MIGIFGLHLRYVMKGMFTTRYDRLTAKQEGNHDVVHHLVRGKMLGGSSGINYMMFVKPSLRGKRTTLKVKRRI